MADTIKGNEHLIQTYGKYNIVLERGENVFLYDNTEKKYLDFGAGIAVFALGYSNDRYKSGLKEQMEQLIHTSNYFHNQPNLNAAKKLCHATNLDRVFFTNSGTEAVEGALKLARKYYFNKHGVGDSNIVAMEHSFHGRSMGALSITSNKSYRQPFEPLLGQVSFATFNDIHSVMEKVNDKTCAIVLELIQGEGGVHVATKEFVKDLRELCTKKDILLIIDEIQSGMGRTGQMFSYQDYNIIPDIITVAKALGCGIPVGAFCAKEEVAKAFTIGDHGSTYGGNPLACKAVELVFDIIEEDNILDNVKEMEEYLFKRLGDLKEKYSSIVEIRGKGLMVGIEFNCLTKPIIDKCLEHGLIIFGASGNVIRLLPPLIIDKSHIDQMLVILEKSIV